LRIRAGPSDDLTSSLRLPEFIIGGAPRSGTSWLYEVLDRHPQVRMARPLKPEPKFFLVDDEYAKGLAYYSQRWFSEIGSDLVAGEKSTNYLESKAAAARVARSIPSAKLIFVLREPADRAMSNFRWTKMNGLEPLDFATALECESAREAEYGPELRYARPHSYFSRGLYAQQLRPYLEHFPRGQILVLRFEDITGQSNQTAARAHSFLGLPERGGDAGMVDPINAAVHNPVDQVEVMTALRKRFAEPNADLAQLLGTDFEMWEKVP